MEGRATMTRVTDPGGGGGGGPEATEPSGSIHGTGGVSLELTPTHGYHSPMVQQHRIVARRKYPGRKTCMAPPHLYNGISLTFNPSEPPPQPPSLSFEDTTSTSSCSSSIPGYNPPPAPFPASHYCLAWSTYSQIPLLCMPLLNGGSRTEGLT